MIEKDSFAQLFEQFHAVPTMQKISNNFDDKIDKLKKQQPDLEALKHRCLHYAEAFWTINQKARCKKLREGVTCKLCRPRAKKNFTDRAKCPVKGCEGKAVNLRRHLAQCYKDLTLQDRQKALDAYGKLKTIRKSLETGKLPPEAKFKSKFNRYNVQYNICDRSYKRIDVHLTKVHLLARGTSAYRSAIENCPLLEEEKAEQITIQVESGSLDLSISDSHSTLINVFQAYVNEYTFLGSYSARKTVTIAARFLQASLSKNVINDISGSTVFKALKNAAGDDGYF